MLAALLLNRVIKRGSGNEDFLQEGYHRGLETGPRDKPRDRFKDIVGDSSVSDAISDDITTDSVNDNVAAVGQTIRDSDAIDDSVDFDGLISAVRTDVTDTDTAIDQDNDDAMLILLMLDED